jgi:hypothetical protein
MFDNTDILWFTEKYTFLQLRNWTGGGFVSNGHSHQKLDLTGQRFGKLTALAPAANVGPRTAWRCQCECGREAIVVTQRLRDGRTRSCGCLKEGGIPKPTYIDGTSPEMLAAAKVARKNNTSGVPGVDWVQSKGLWRASICFKGRRHYLGSYSKFEDAVKARKRAEGELHDSFLQEVAAQAARQ